MIYLSQRDPKWSLLKLGGSKITVGRYGCTTTALSMLSDYFKCYVSPADIAKKKEYYTADGLIIWQNLRFANMHFVNRGYTFSEVVTAIATADPNRAIIFQVDGFHWVVVVGKTLFGNDYVIIDPWDGKKKNLKSAYKKITGYAIFGKGKK